MSRVMLNALAYTLNTVSVLSQQVAHDIWLKRVSHAPPQNHEKRASLFV
jgi:hypothetical protein